MNTQGKSVLAGSVAAALGVVPGAADAAVFGATLTQVLTYSNNGTAGTAANISSSNATFTYDDVTNLLTQTGGLYQIRLTTAPTTTLYRTSITGLILGNGGVATATTYVCQEGNFGTNVGSSICGNYNFGANFANETTTTWGPGTAVGRTAGGDDNIVGPQQSIAGQDGFNEISFVGTTLVLANKTCTGICTTTTGGFNAGQQWTLTATPLGPVDDTASAEAGQPLSIDVLANDTGLTDPVTVTVTVAPNNGGTATVAGSPGPKANIRINYTSAPGFSGTETFTYRAQAGALDDTGLVTVTVEDTVPTAITFTSQTGVALSTPVTSNTVAIGGISTAVPISVSNGQYSIDGGAFTSAAGTVQNNQDVAVRHTSAATPASDIVTTLTVGGSSTVQGTFTSTTVLPDTVPDAFSFPAQTDVALNTAITSAPATITGINTAAPISITGGQYSIDGGAYTSAAGTINNNQSVTVRQTSSATNATPTTATLTVGTVAASFTVTTTAAPPDTIPDAFSFPAQTNVALNTAITSAPATITGINTAAPISITGGQYSIDGGAYTSAAGTINNNQAVTVRQTSSGTNSTPTTATLTVGTVAANFTVTTEAAPPDTIPDTFSFPAQTNVALNTAITSAPATITGINTPAPISITGGQYSIDGGAYTSAAGTINNNQSVTVRQTSSATSATPTTATLTVGTVPANFTVTTTTQLPDTIPDPFSFVDQEDVGRDTEIVSEPVEITGINSPAPILVTGGEYSIDGAEFTSVQGVVSAGQLVRVRHTSASTTATAVTTVLSVGAAGAGTQVSDAFSSTTRRNPGSSSADGLILGVLGLLGLVRRRKPRN